MANDKPLIPLDYCSPERAARLLGCEVEDIFHWAAVGAITLYADFYDHELNAGMSDGFMTEEIFIDETVPSHKVRDIDHHELSALAEEVINQQKINGLSGLTYLTSLRECKFDTLPPDEHCTAVDYGPKGFRYGTKFYLRQPNDGVWARHVYISGLWAIDKSNVFRAQIPVPLDTDMGWDITATYIDGQDPDPVGIELLGVVVSNMEQRFRVVREDLLRMQQHMLTGEVMPKHFSKPRPEKAHSSPNDFNQAARRGRVTSKQCCFIVELLRSHGLTDDDFQGSIGALRLKIANRIPGFGDPQVDDNTLIDWLKKAGVR